MILDETRERFIKAILKQVDPARIAEIHFFAPIRQGGVESGVAVVAATERAPEPVVDQSHIDPVPPIEETAQDVADEPQAEEPAEATEADVEEIVEGAADEPQVVEIAEGAVVEPQAEETAEGAVVEAQAEETAEGALDAEEESPYSDAVEEPASADSSPSEAEPQDTVVAVAPIERHVIYTARYRHTLKGPDRGKWEASVNAEADAPLITVDAVVRGVQRRSGDVDDATRMSGDDVRTALPATV